jgi:citrate lyase subunit beta/citryl-CoA lyase
VRLRSLLFTPGTQPERIEKALRSGAADVVVADLEDAVAPRDKIEARIAVRNALLATAGKAKAARAVRINAWPSKLAEEDLAVLLTAKPELIVVPKAHDVAAIEALDARIAAVEDEPGSIGLVLIVETAAGVLAAARLAAFDRVVALAFGAEDLAADVGMRRSPDNHEVAVARGQVVLAAAASGKAAIDMICADYQDLDRARREAGQARDLGYRGKMCIHPAQVPVVHEAFAATKAERDWARKVVAAAENAGAASGGVVVVDGRMVDVPLVEQARRLLAQQD